MHVQVPKVNCGFLLLSSSSICLCCHGPPPCSSGVRGVPTTLAPSSGSCPYTASSLLANQSTSQPLRHDSLTVEQSIHSLLNWFSKVLKGRVASRPLAASAIGSTVISTPGSKASGQACERLSTLRSASQCLQGVDLCPLTRDSSQSSPNCEQAHSPEQGLLGKVMSAS